jgi:hypothetical protein
VPHPPDRENDYGSGQAKAEQAKADAAVGDLLTAVLSECRIAALRRRGGRGSKII